MVPAVAPADSGRLRHSSGRVPPVATAARVARAPRLDGRLDDEAWQAAEAIDGFRQVLPNDGADPTVRTEVRIVYDDQAIYVGARMFDAEPHRIERRLGRRDNTDGDLFTVIFDSYHDHRTGFRFRVNAAGVRGDGITFNDNSFGDEGWDPVWDAEVGVDSLGWTAELRIPFSQLRFASRGADHWGVSFARVVFRTNEFVRWSWAPNTETGFASQFGHLAGISGIPHPRRLEVLPYSVASSRHREGADPANPFDDGSLQSGNAGLDVKYGLTSDLTIDATINPDFGQVEADPAVVNLSAFETFFSERRPFFVEGSNLFRFGGGNVFGAPQLFYSRRIGRSPSRLVSEPGGYSDMPQASTILGAAKLSGRVAGWSVGLLEAVTAREYARLQRSDGSRYSAPVEPLTNYAVLSLRRDLRGGSSGFGILATAVNRDADSLFNFLRSSAYVTGADFFHRFSRNRFSVNGSFAVSTIRGDSVSIIAAQRSSARYFQRPDQDYVSLDSTATSMTGWAASLSAGKVAGNWTYGTDFYAYSPRLEVNDAGFMGQVDRVFYGVRLGRRWLRPGRVFRQASLNASHAQVWNFGGARVGRNAWLGGNGELRNYWRLGFNLNRNFSALSDKTTRGGPMLRSPSSWNINFWGNTDFRRPIALNPWGGYSRSASGAWGWWAGTYVQFRPNGALTLSLSPGFERSHQTAFYVSQGADAGATATYGRRYVFARLDQRTFDLTLRAELALTPRLTLQLVAQPFFGAGDYYGFREFDRPGGFHFIEYGTDNGSTVGFDADANTYTIDPDGPTGARAPFQLYNPDFRFRSLRGNAVLRWEWRAGSTLFVVWTHGRSGFSTDPAFRLGEEFGNLWRDNQENTLLVKVSYWLSM